MTQSEEKPKIVLVLQGGGALGAYHIGAYQALAEQGLAPDWICGISIGAINAAILAGNTPQNRLKNLENFWQKISWPAIPLHLGHGFIRTMFNTFSNAQALTIGQPHFFSPRPLSPLIAPPGPPESVSFYDTTALLATLSDFSDFALINQKITRLTLGATNVETGDLEFFDNVKNPVIMRPDHVLASGSLPPGFPATRIGKNFYWDGGCVSNTPLEAVLEDLPVGHTIVFMVDLWNAEGPAPRTLNDVLWREKQIQYASRTAQHIDAVATKVNLRHAMHMLGQSQAGEAALPDDTALTTDRLDIVHIIYRPSADQISSSDAEFSRESIAERSAAGRHDMKHAIEAAPWFHAQKPAHLGAMVHRLCGGKLTTLPEPNLRTTTDRKAA